MYDQVYRYLDLPGQVRKKKIRKTRHAACFLKVVCVQQLLASVSSLPVVCVCFCVCVCALWEAVIALDLFSPFKHLVITNSR